MDMVGCLTSARLSAECVRGCLVVSILMYCVGFEFGLGELTTSLES